MNPSGRRCALPWFLAALLLVVLRCAPSIWFEQLDFDSDQAIVGLMAKHLVEGRHFPLFFYGQHYMLGVQAWLAAPFFALGGPTIAMLRLPLLIVNVAVVFWLMAALIDRGVAAGVAFVATLPLIAPGMVASLQLMATLGASIEPFLYVLLLWHLRSRPIAFGALYAVGYLHREFVLFAGPALLVTWLIERPRVDRSAATYAVNAALAFAAVWLIVDQVSRRINTLGPPGGEFVPGTLFAQSQLVMMRLEWDWHAYVARLAALGRETLRDLFAARPEPSWYLGINSKLTFGSAARGIAFVTAFVVSAVACVGGRGDNRQRRDGFYLYLGLIAVQTILAYALNGGIDPALRGVPRYVLFTLLIPIAVFGAAAARHPSRIVTAAMSACIVVWAASNIVDNIRLLHEYLSTPPPNERRLLADYLVSHHIRYGRAEYWDSYVIDFLARERVILAPIQTMRISAYDARVERNAANAVTVVRQPCDTGARVALWCVEDPFHR